MNYTDQLCRLIGVPEIQVDPVRDRTLSESLGIQLPSDYLQWASQYETLEICNEMIVWNWLSKLRPLPTPASVGATLEGIDLARATAQGRENVLDSEDNATGPRPWLPIYPEAGGLFPWGTDTNGTLYLWDARNSDPDDWTVVLYNRSWREFDCGFTEFLVRLMRQEYRNSRMFIREWPWLSTVRELESEDSGALVWHTPRRWSDYFEEYSRRRDDIDYEWDDFSWVDRFRGQNR
ncbi:hypothetical protein [Glycomyces sp. NRRL B-16210]|uniref:hypothetical protein n=1 Tax=Glycomyces sp. NRRL B-16210 TaxID=1463821 RepID=UPI0010621B9D|nr:hypothetical protein [Glycomyces sp. NRRL B-16210]